MSFSPSLPTAAANPVSTNFSWATSAANWGINAVVVRATDNFTETRDDSVFYIINTPPQFATSQGNANVIAGQTFSYTFSGTDADIPQGDEIELSHTTYPAWMSIVDNNNGTWTISGTPAVSDSGDHDVILNLEDKTNHYRGTHCGSATQSFRITVIPCNITTSTTTTDVLCHGAITGSIDLQVNDATSPVSYVWSNSATTEDLTNIGAGTYTVAITDANGCTAADTAEITEPATAVAGAIAVSPVTTIPGHESYTIYLGYGAQSVTLTASGADGTPGYSYSWSTGASTAAISVSPTVTTTYSVVITDANGCTKTVTQKIKVIDARCGNNNNKVLVCHIPSGNNSNPQSVCISANAVQTHLDHGCYVGPCGAAKGGAGAEEESLIGNVGEVAATEWSVYPNPSNGVFVLEMPFTDDANIIISNLSGQVVYRKSVSGTAKVSVDMQGAAKGVYIMQVTNGHDTYRSKLTVQ